MPDWIKKTGYHSVAEFVLGTTGCTAKELTEPEPGDPRKIDGLAEAADLIHHAVRMGTPVTIVGDYDSDGLNATAILVRLFRHMGVEPKTIIPRRMSDGYGLSRSIVNMIRGGLVITIDNGIAAVDEVRQLREAGCQVIVIDHHLPGPELPPANVLVDPQVHSWKNEFCGYCGAGLGYQLAMLLLEGDKTADSLRRSLTVHAAIATITDVMPMLGPNRRIVMDGLEILNGDPRSISPGLAALGNNAGVERFTESDIGFKLGPMINAPARLYDRGGTSVLKALVCDDPADAFAYAEKMFQINENRKRLTRHYTEQIQRTIQTEGLEHEVPLVVVGDNIPEGLVGIIAGSLTNQYGVASFVLTRQKGEAGVLKGSGRANTKAGVDLAPVLDAIRPMCVACGGHAGAAGLSLREKDLPEIKRTMRKVMAGMEAQIPSDQFYDLEISENDIPQVFQELNTFMPYGEGCPLPVIMVRDFQTSQRFGSHYRFIGQEKDSVRINGRQCDIFGYKTLAGTCTSFGMPAASPRRVLPR